MNEIGTLIKEIPEPLFVPSAMWGHSKKWPAMNPEVGAHQIMELPSFWSCEKKVSLFISHPVYDILL